MDADDLSQSKGQSILIIHKQKAQQISWDEEMLSSIKELIDHENIVVFESGFDELDAVIWALTQQEMDKSVDQDSEPSYYSIQLFDHDDQDYLLSGFTAHRRLEGDARMIYVCLKDIQGK